jgi:type II secretory pathway pseudopilin PulG
VSFGRIGGGATVLHQRGFALIAMLVLAAMITAFLITIGLNQGSAELSNAREDRSMSALRQAKAALIAYAASEQMQSTGGATPFQPGALPCPDLDNNGIAEDHEFPQNPCNLAKERVGRFPWATVGSDDLRDASGERLWYAVSANFLKNTPAYKNVINSDTQGQLTVTGAAPAANVVAILFAPGQVVQNQSRVPTNPATYNDPANFLEQFNNVTYAVFASAAPPSDTLNDRLLVVTAADLMSAVEPVVAANIERDVKPFLNTYALASQWGRFPFPVIWNSPDPGTSGGGTSRSPMLFVGDPSSNSNGLLPISGVVVSAASNASPIVVTTYSPHALFTGNTVLISGVLGNIAANGKWAVTVVDATHFQLNGSSGSGAYGSGGTVTPSYPWSNWSVNKAGGSGTIDNDSCSTVNTPPPYGGLQCTFRASDENCGGPHCILNLAFQIQAQVGQNAGRTFATLPDPLDAVTTIDGSSSTFTSVSLHGSLNTNGVGFVTYTGTLSSINCPNFCPNHNVSVTIPDVVSSSVTTVSSPPTSFPAAWFITNEWYRQTFYAVATDLLPGAGGSCATNPPCLTVNNLPPRFSVPSDKQAILIFAGLVLNSSIRPSNQWNNYMEGANQTALATQIYENRSGTPTSINDRIVVVAP